MIRKIKKLPPRLKTTGYILLMIGIGLLFWGYQLSGSIDSQITLAYTGTSADKVMNAYISGVISFVIGLFIVIRK